MTSVTQTLTIENVVVCSGVDQEIDLERLHVDLPDSRYDRDRFPGLVYRPADHEATSLIYRTGKLISTGAPSIEKGTTAMEMTITELRDRGIAAPATPEVSVENIVLTGDLGHRLDLDIIAIDLGLVNVEYEPEQFPGLIYRLSEPELVALLFGSGSVLIAGAKRLETAEEGIETLYSQLDARGLLD